MNLSRAKWEKKSSAQSSPYHTFYIYVYNIFKVEIRFLCVGQFQIHFHYSKNDLLHIKCAQNFSIFCTQHTPCKKKRIRNNINENTIDAENLLQIYYIFWSKQ